MRRALLVAARLCATAPATIVSNGAAYADLKRCARAYARAAPVVVTSADTTYLRFLPAWSAALARWGHGQQVVIDVDVQPRFPRACAVLRSDALPHSVLSLHAWRRFALSWRRYSC